MPFKLDPEVGAAMARLAAPGQALPPKAALGDYNGRRERIAMMFKSLSSPIPKNVRMRDYETTGIDRNKILLRSYQRESAPNGGPGIIYLHGGGYIAGSVDLCDSGVAVYASQSDALLLAVEYRLAPETQYPGNVADAYAGLLWLHEHATELGIDSEKIAIMGESGGGGLAAALAHYNLEQGGPTIAKQILIYPMLDDRNINEDPHIGAFAIWNHIDNETGWSCILGSKRGTANVLPSAAPARMTDARGLPPLYIEVGELDIFRDEDIEYARKFGMAGIEAELHLHPGCPHAFEGLAPTSNVARRAYADRFRAIQTIGAIEGPAKL